MSGSQSARQSTPNSGGTSSAQLQNQNAAARRAILAVSQNMAQVIQGGTITNPGNANNVLNLEARPVGFLKRFWVEVVATIQNSDASNDVALTPWGPANIFSNVQFVDLSNNTRINCTGWFLHQVATVKRGRPYGCAFLNDGPVDYGNNYPVISASPFIPKGGTNTGTVRMIFDVPISYSDTDFRGGIWLGVTGNTAQLQFTINPNPGSQTYAQGGDPTLAIYQGSNNVQITSLTYKVYQNYLDQMPRGQNGQIVLPINDISTVYLLNTVIPPINLTNNQDVPIPYSNFRDFLSTSVIFDNGGQLNNGSDVNYWAIQAANYVNMINVDPAIMALWARNMIQDDMPVGSYYFSHRHKPISVLQFGNQYLVLNASTVNVGAKLMVGYEMFALVNLVAQAGALTFG
jgi:hypothetical protein